ncbi:transcriptional attenuator, LytR family [Clostridium cavendishii DSM 21758]|uniref:Transcriptional attenuator, LytR family n=1 Tax=Clostridium cavendishii DSM 21758 TaxID=1121302 RepID=A0A1M6D3X6_9CLOT|nr:LCP family protein [Clostridium cavendishii]SHI67995.1 transcriptional attenuator, LytR family [Clostridium cavendishii DSM 21758]
MEKRSEKNRSNNKNKKPKKKMKKSTKIILLSLLGILVFVVGFGGFYLWNMTSGIKKTDISKSDMESSMDNNVKGKYSDIINIALFGVDRRAGDTGRSDATMFATIDKKHGKLKLTSIMRDSYVSIDGHGMDKLNHAYAFGGGALSIKTINQNFGLNITDYVAVDFGELVNIIDALGGVDIDVMKNAVSETNKYIDDVAKETKKTGAHISAPGMQHLTGVQAVGYCRIRYNDNDFARTDRQRDVLVAMFNKIKTTSPTKLPGIIKELSPYLETSLSTTDMIGLGTDVLQSGIGNIQQQILPIEGLDNCKGGIASNGVFYFKYDKDALKKRMQNYIFEDIDPKNK